MAAMGVKGGRGRKGRGLRTRVWPLNHLFLCWFQLSLVWLYSLAEEVEVIEVGRERERGFRSWE